MSKTCHHGHAHNRCSICIPKARWPKGSKVCRCKVLVPKDWRLCPKCINFEGADFYSRGFDVRASNHAVCRVVNG